MYLIACILWLTLSLAEVSCRPTRARYALADNRPLNIAHRGLCSILPENTLQAFEAALYQGADFIELDVVYTAEKQLLVMHDPYLTRITNIKTKPEFAKRYSTRTYNGKSMTNWWTDQMKLSELKTLGIKQDQAPGRVSVFDYKFTFPTLSEVIEMVIGFNNQHNGTRNSDGRLAGILIEAKDSQMYRDKYGMEIGQTILQLLNRYKIDSIDTAAKICPIYLHSFDYGTVKYWGRNTELPINFLIEKSATFNLTDINLYATGIGFEDNIIWNYTQHAKSNVLNECRSIGLLVHVWTFKDDVLLFNAPNNLQAYKIAQKELRLDGVITQFSDIYAPVSQLYRSQMHKTTDSLIMRSMQKY